MNFSIIFRLLSAIQFSLCLAFLVCIGTDLIFRDSTDNSTLWGFAYSLIVALSTGSLLLFLGRKKETTFFKKEALAVIGLGWISASLVGALPYLFILENCSYPDALFEAASGLSTTGASIFSEFEHFPKSLLFWRSLSQWIGGMGVVVFFIAILSFLGAGGKILYSNEASASAADLDSPRIQSGVIRIGVLYLTLSLLCMIAFKLGGMGTFDAINHAFTTLSTGGFSTLEASFAGFQSPLLEWIAIVFMMAGGTSFLWILFLAKRSWRNVRSNSEVLSFFGIILLATTLTTLVIVYLDGYSNWNDAIRTSLFQVVSVMTTTGFATADFAEWHLLAQVMLMALMAIGGCSGSTAGGLKVTRIQVGLKAARRMIANSFSKRVVRPITMNGRVLNKDSREEVVTYLLLSAWVIFFSVPLLAILEPELSYEGSYSAILACFFNIGPGMAEFGPSHNFGFLHDSSKYLLSFLMIMGRLELYAILALFLPSFWKRFS